MPALSEVEVKGEAESINNFKFLIELSITQFIGFGGKFSLFEFMKKKDAVPVGRAPVDALTPVLMPSSSARRCA